VRAVIALGVAEAPAPAGGRPHGWRTRLPALTLPALAVALLLVLGWSLRFSADDAFINFRVVKQIEAGHGPVYNIGERVEVATSTLWLVILLVADLLSPLRIEWTAVFLELALGAVGLGAAMAGAVRLADLGRSEPRTGGWIVPVGAVAYLGPYAAWSWVTGGLENALGLAWIGTTFLASVTLIADAEPSRRRVLLTACLVGLGVTVRPDFAILCAGLGVPVAVAAWRAGRLRRVLEAAAAAAALPVAVQIFRMGYYAQLFPNAYYAKESTRAWWDQGWRYLRNFADSYALVVPAGVVAAWLVAGGLADRGHGRRDRWLVIGALEAAAIGHAVAVVRVGGDHMHARLLIPAWFTLLLPLAALPAGALRIRRNLAAALALAVWAAVAAFTLRPPDGSLLTADAGLLMQIMGGPPPPPGGWTGIANASRYGNTVTAEESVIWRLSLDGGASAAADLFEPRAYPPGSGTEIPVSPRVGRTVVSTYPAGAPGYQTPLDVWVFDRLGLAEPVAARLRLDQRATPGHEKTLPAPWIAAVFVAPDHVITDPASFMPPDFEAAFMVGIDLSSPPTEPDTFADARADARQALACGGLREHLHDIRAPLTPRRFLGNIVDAVRLDGLRVPSDPHEARRELCGD
jgi:arabinofuranosyltransferase